MNSHRPDFSILDHTADLGITVRGTDLKDLFEGAARSVMQVIVKGSPSGHTMTRTLRVSGKDLADLMVCWLGEILYLLDGEKEVVVDVQIDSISKSRLEATIEVEPFDPGLHEILCEIKAVTYHQIEVAKKADRWEATVIFDM